MTGRVRGSSLGWLNDGQDFMQFRMTQACCFQLSIHTENRSIVLAIVHASGQYLKLVSHVFLQVARINGGCRKSSSATTVNVSICWMTLLTLAGHR